MDFKSGIGEPITPASSYETVNYWRAEDSGYHTSYTPGSFDCLDTSNENLEPISAKKNKFLNDTCEVEISENTLRCSRKLKRLKRSTVTFETCTESPVKSRNLKRSYQDDVDLKSPLPTPTSSIAGGIQKLNVNDNQENCLSYSLDSQFLDSISSHLQTLDNSSILTYPTTPVKKIKSYAKYSPLSHNGLITSPLRAINNLSSPPRRSSKKLSFSSSLSGETQSVCRCNSCSKLKPQSKVVRTIFHPEQKIDIIAMLYNRILAVPAIKKILYFLSNEDIYNFSLVSPTWLQVCEDNAKSRKEEYVKFITNTKENHENRIVSKPSDGFKTTAINQKTSGTSLKDIHNIVNFRRSKQSPKRSPPTTPKSRRFKTFTKSASMDSRIQLVCVRCQQPAKVTEETTGEEWAECTSISCSFNFCRFCKCERHPDKLCFRYDLDGPSPSKKKKVSAVGTKKSKKILRRLLN